MGKDHSTFLCSVASFNYSPISWGFTAPKSVKKIAVEKRKAVAKVIKKQAKVDKNNLEGFVVGKNLNVGMTPDKTITLL